MKIEQLYTTCLAQGAYYISSNGEVAIIDPLRETQQYIDRANREKAKATAAARRARLEDQLTMADIKNKLGADDRAALSALTKLLDNPAVYDDPDKQLQIEQQIQFYINKARGSSLADLAERGGARYGASPTDMAQRIQELEAASRIAKAREAAKTKSEG